MQYFVNLKGRLGPVWVMFLAVQTSSICDFVPCSVCLTPLKMTVRGTMVRSELYNFGCFFLGSYILHQHFKTFDISWHLEFNDIWHIMAPDISWYLKFGILWLLTFRIWHLIFHEIWDFIKFEIRFGANKKRLRCKNSQMVVTQILCVFQVEPLLWGFQPNVVASHPLPEKLPLGFWDRSHHFYFHLQNLPRSDTREKDVLNNCLEWSNMPYKHDIVFSLKKV